MANVNPDGAERLVAALWRQARKDLARGRADAWAWLRGEDESGGADFAYWCAGVGERATPEEVRARLAARLGAASRAIGG